MPVLTNISNTNSISFNQIATQASISLSNVSMTQLANAYSGVSNVGDIPICEFYSNGCPPAPNTSTYPYNIAVGQADTVGEQVAVWWTPAGALPFTLASYTIWMKVDSGSWTLRQTGVSSGVSTWTDISTQPGFTLCYRVQAIGTGGQKSPSDADMILLGAYPPNDCVFTEDFTPTTI